MLKLGKFTLITLITASILLAGIGCKKQPSTATSSDPQSQQTGQAEQSPQSPGSPTTTKSRLM